ncbi:hypothetical protein [Azospirillum sp. ST 5-10]|uniref:hypothetical protein n=1 Tax=unclassified Azospirillum TaxID=2630922 RepID=UPI003F4A484C
MYLPPIQVFQACVKLDRQAETATMPIEVLGLLLQAAAAGVGFDAQWYRAMNDDVRQAIESGKLESELQHFGEAGYFEGRRLSPLNVDEDWYSGTYEDVAEAIASGKVANAHSHYNSAGYHEGRAPHADARRLVDRWMHLAATMKGDAPVDKARASSRRNVMTV